MASIQDDRGYNQGFRPSVALAVRTERRCDYMISKMGLATDTRILEIGCGTGEISYLLARKTGKYVLGIDVCGPFIEEAKQKYSLPNLDYEILDFNNVSQATGSFLNRKFDYIVGNGILHHLFCVLDDTLKRIHDMLSENGKIIFLEPNILNPYCLLIFRVPIFRKISHLEPDEMAFSKKFIETKLAQWGFINIRVEYKDFLLPNTPEPLIKSVIQAGAVLEKLPFLKMLSQSIFISASCD